MNGLLQLGEIPESAASFSLDLMPIDICAEEILHLKSSTETVFHIIHPQPPTLEQVLKALKDDFKVVDDTFFSYDLREKSRMLDCGVIALVMNHWILLKTKPSTICVSCEKTMAELEKTGFAFPDFSTKIALKEFLKEGIK